jgi:hypothetical protein
MRKLLYLFWIIWFLPFLVPFNTVAMGSAKLFPLDFILPILCVAYVIDLALNRFNPLSTAIDKLIALVLVIGTISVLRGIPQYSYQAFGEGRILVFVILFFLTRRYWKAAQLKDLKFFVFLLFFRAIYNIGLGISNYSGGRTGDFLEGINQVTYFHILGGANSTLVLLPVVLIVLQWGKLKIKWLAALYSLLSLAIVFLASVRSVFIAAIVSVLAYLLFEQKRLRSVLAIGVAGCLVYLFLTSNITTLANRSVVNAAVSLTKLTTDANTKWRLARAAMEVNRVLRAGTFEVFFGLPMGSWFARTNIGFFSQGLSTHISYIDLFTKVGILGLGCIVFVYWKILRIAFLGRNALDEDARFYFYSIVIIAILLVGYPGLQNYNISVLLGAFMGSFLNICETKRLIVAKQVSERESNKGEIHQEN